MTDLDTLSDEVREAFRRMDRDAPLGYSVDEEWQTVRAELLRLTKCEIALAAERDHARLLHRKAEAELAALKADHAALEELCDATVRANLALGHVEE